MLFRRFLVSLWLCVSYLGAHPNHQLDLTYTKPAVAAATDGLPLGNGYFGALVLGGVTSDRIQLTDPLLRNAQDQLLPLGELVIATPHREDEARTFMRRLDLQTGVVEIGYRHGPVRYRREYFASYPDRLFVGRFRARRKKSINHIFSWKTTLPEARPAFDLEKQRFFLIDAKQKVRIAMDIRLNDGEARYENDQLHIEGASELTFFLTTAGDGFSPDKHLNGLTHDDAITIHQRHLPDYQTLFHAMYLTLEGGAKTQLVTNRRLEEYQSQPDHDPGFEELLFQYGRYLMIASSREKSPTPAHRRGIWYFPPKEPVTNTHDPGGTLPLSYLGNAYSQLQACLPEKVPINMSAEIKLGGPPTLPAHQARAMIQAARAKKGDEALAQMRMLLQTNLNANLLCRHQDLSGNFGMIGGLTEMLIREDNGVTALLPALPKAWSDGSAVGLLTPSHEVAVVWAEGALLESYVTSLQGEAFQLRHGKPLGVARGTAEPIVVKPNDLGVCVIPIEAEETVRLIFEK